MSSSVHVNNRTKNILVLGKYFVQGLDNTTIYAEKLYSINFTENNKKFCLTLHYNGANSYLFVNGTEIHKFRAKDCDNSIMFRKHFKRLFCRLYEKDRIKWICL